MRNSGSSQDSVKFSRLFILVKVDSAATLRAQKVNEAAANLGHKLTLINCISRTVVANSDFSKVACLSRKGCDGREEPAEAPCSGITCQSTSC